MRDEILAAFAALVAQADHAPPLPRASPAIAAPVRLPAGLRHHVAVQRHCRAMLATGDPRRYQPACTHADEELASLRRAHARNPATMRALAVFRPSGRGLAADPAGR